MSVFNDLRQFKNPELPTSVDGTLPLRPIPKKRQGQRRPRPGQLHRDARGRRTRGAGTARRRRPGLEHADDHRPSARRPASR